MDQKSRKKYQATPSKSYSKANPKIAKLKQLQNQLQQLYRSDTIALKRFQFDVYQRCIELTEEINNQVENISHVTASFISNKKSKKKQVPVLDIRDVLSNNIAFGLKIKRNEIVAGFIYVTARVLREGLHSLTYYLGIIKSMRKNSYIITKQASHTMLKSSITEASQQIDIACQVRFFLKVNEIVEEKSEALLKKALICLIRIVETQRNDEELYHWGFKQFKVSNKFLLYFQYLTSYFSYLEHSDKSPTLDIARLMIELLSFNCPDQLVQHSQAIGFLIRKCFYFIGAKSVFIEDQVLAHLSKVSLTIKSNCQKTILAVFQWLLKIDRIHLLCDDEEFKHLKFEGKQSATSRKSVIVINRRDLEPGKCCKFLCSIVLKLRKIKKVKSQQNYHEASLIYQHLSKYIHCIMSADEAYLPIWDYIINEIHTLKSELITKYSNRNVFKNSSLIIKYSIFIEIQDLILTNPLHIQASHNHYFQYTSMNVYLLIIHALVAKLENFKKQMIELIDRLHWLGEQGLPYWDKLAYLGLFYITKYFESKSQKHLLEVQQFSTFDKISFFMKMLLKEDKIPMTYLLKEDGSSLKLAQNLLNIAIFLCSPNKISQKTQRNFRLKSKQLFTLKYWLFLGISKIIEKILEQTANRIESSDLAELLGFYFPLYSIFKTGCKISEFSKLKKIKLSIRKYSSLKMRIIQRQIFSRVIAQHLEFYSHDSKVSHTTSNLSNLSMESLDSISLMTEDQLDWNEQVVEKNMHGQLTEGVLRNYLEEFCELEPNKILTKQQKEYESLLVIDFLYWLKHFCSHNTFPTFGEIANEKLEDFIITQKQSTNYRQSFANRYLLGIDQNICHWQSETRTIAQYLVNMSEESMDIEIVFECYNKLFYLLHNHIQATSQQKGQENNEINIQFEIQEASIHISKLIKLIKKFQAKICGLLSLDFDHIDTEEDILNRLSQSFDQIKLININRIVTSINNILSISARLGYQRHGLGLLLVPIKLILVESHNPENLPYIKAELIFLGYLPNDQNTRHSIQQYLETQKHKQLKNPLNNSHSEALNYISLFINHEYFSNSMENKKKSKLHELVFSLQNVEHMHPHKKMIRHLSGHIWAHHSINQSRILNYQQPLLPITYSTFISSISSNKTKIHKPDNDIFECSSSQIFHHMLGKVLFQILRCLAMNGQKSQFRSILKLSLIYFMRSRQLSELLFTLQCYLMKGSEDINIFLITDSLKVILTEINGDTFQGDKFDRWCTTYLSNSTRSRKSGVMNCTPVTIARSLFLCLQKCKEQASRIFSILMSEVSKKMNIPEWIKFFFSISLQPNPQPIEMNIWQFIDELKGYLIDKKPLKLTLFNKYQAAILEKIRKTISRSYYHSRVLQSVLGELISDYPQHQFNDLTVLELSVLMLDHNYLYKQMTQQVSSLYTRYDGIHEIISLSNKIYQNYYNSYLDRHFQKMGYLGSDRLKYPFTIIYPFGDKVYSIGVKQTLLVIPLDKFHFDDYVNIIIGLLASNQSILNDKKIEAREWWKNRDRFNREISKIINEVDIGMWDIDVSNDESGLTHKAHKMLLSLKQNCYMEKSSLQRMINAIKERYEVEFRAELGEISIANIEKVWKSIKVEKTLQNQNLLLLVPPQYSMLPFQTSQYLSRQRAVYRIPSTSYILENQPKKICRLLDIKQTAYLVNSRNDLPETQQSFMKIKQNFLKWRGLIGKKPSLTEIMDLFNSELFLFMGHGAGVSHIPEKQFYNKRIKCSMMLFGCNSVAMAHNKCEFHGIAHSYLSNGCSCLLGCLWEVTDRDTDKLTQKLFKSILQGPQNIAKLMTLCRKKCRHQYLNGGAIVLYGLPTYYHCQ